MRFPRSPKRFESWMAGLHEHHDHAQSHDGMSVARFSPVILCDQCNAADGAAKRQLSLPPDFSFTPQEIAQFVMAQPHLPHTLDLSIAQSIYDTITRSRMEV
jgi:hypothetical protein